MNENKETYRYTYSAAQQEEIEAIRKKYLPQEVQTDKMAQLRQLDAGVTRKGMTASLVVGILGTITMGAGMSLIMTDLGQSLGIPSATVPGLLLGILGMIGVIVAYPLYQSITKRERARIAPQILKLTEELSRQ